MLDFIKVPVDMNREKSAPKAQKRLIQLMTDIALDFKKTLPERNQSIGIQGHRPCQRRSFEC
ncbi:hypothetical protein [Bdellovibrio bacteriovorus]|uniref:hypothetical protein n=1 Tax=Bdellovibrio bacteriovorus TaxID=959 RepID=UPI0035A63275